MFLEVTQPMTKKTEMRKTRFSPLLFPHPHSLTANYVLTNQSTPASGRKGKKKGMKDCYLIAHITERTVSELHHHAEAKDNNMVT